jgi:lysozyme family protein
MANVNQIILHTIEREGGEQHDALDHGNVVVQGEVVSGTNYGLTYDKMVEVAGKETYLDGTENPHFGISTDPKTMGTYIESLSINEATEIYSHQTAHLVGLQQLNDDKVGELIFDQAVNSGSTVAVNTVQATMAINGTNVSIDGRMGEHTIDAINSQNPHILANQLYDARETMNQSMAQTQPQYLHSWQDRLEGPNGIGRSELTATEKTAYENSYTITNFQSFLNETSGSSVKADGFWGQQTISALSALQNGDDRTIHPDTREAFINWSFQKEMTAYTQNYQDALWATHNDPEKAQTIATDKYYESLPGSHLTATAEQKEARIMEHIDSKYGPVAVQTFHEVRQNEVREIQHHHDQSQSHSHHNQVDHTHEH